MADTKTSGLAELAEVPASGDLFMVVDVSDTTMDAGGTNKKVTAANALWQGGLATPKVRAIAGSYYLGTAVNLAGGKTMTTEAMFNPVTFPHDVTVDRIGMFVSATHASATAVRLGIYNSRADGLPGTVLLNAGTVDASVSTGLKEITVSQALKANTLYWLAFTVNAGTPQGWGPGTGTLIGYDLGRGAGGLDTNTYRVYDPGNSAGAFRDVSAVSLTLNQGSYAQVVVRVA